MTIHTDPNAAHACYSPSSAHRWVHCTASAEAISRLPEQEEGEAAAKGTAAHEELERILSGGEPDADHDSAYGIALAVSYVKQLPHGRLWVEQRVALTDQIWGRCDVAHWHEDSGVLTIVDLKDGFVDVAVEENEQLRIYGAASMFTHQLPVKWLRYVVVQPNSIVPGPRVKQWFEPVDTLYDWAGTVAAIPRGKLEFKAGENCKYCPLFGLCPASQDVLLQLNAIIANPPDAVPAAQIAIFKACEKPITDWFKSLDKVATKAALAGSVPPGMKLVTGTTRRAWKDEAAARAAVIAKCGVDALDPPTPTQAEKLGVDISTLADKPEGAPVLAFESDKRPAFARKSAAQMFKGVAGRVQT